MLKIIHKYVVSSTQDYAWALLPFCTSDTLVIADIQTAGRGSHRERVWVSNEGNFHGSFIINVSKIGYNSSNLSFLNTQIMLALQKTLIEITKNNNIKIKLPNDIYYNKKKLAGVLIETSYPFAVIGIGINLISAPLKTSTSIKDAFCIEISNKEIDFINNLYNRILLTYENNLK